MDPLKKGRKKWLIPGVITVAVLAVLLLFGPVIITRYMNNKTPDIPQADFMMKVKGTIKSSNNTVYLKGDNGLYYILIGDRLDELSKNLDKAATVFGNMYTPEEGEKVDGNPVRMKIEVINFGLPDLG